MGDTLESLILDLLAWLAPRERSYEEVMDAWRTSCPKFPVWEDANDQGLVTKVRVGDGLMVRITAVGVAHLRNPHHQGVSLSIRSPVRPCAHPPHLSNSLARS